MANLADSVYRRVLVVRCQLGDREAFAELVARCQPTLRAFLHKLLASGDNADDVAQEVWMDVFRGLPRLTDPGAFGPWLYRIAHNRAYRLLRRRPEPVSSIRDVELADDAEPEPQFTAEDAHAVHAAINDVPSEQIVAFSRSKNPSAGKKHFEEDLVELLMQMGHSSGNTVTLSVRDDLSGNVQTLRDVPMTEANRNRLWQAGVQRDLSAGNSAPVTQPATQPSL